MLAGLCEGVVKGVGTREFDVEVAVSDVKVDVLFTGGGDAVGGRGRGVVG